LLEAKRLRLALKFIYLLTIKAFYPRLVAGDICVATKNPKRYVKTGGCYAPVTYS
jgi:hypothetical protein